jgi:hypothetical protein
MVLLQSVVNRLQATRLTYLQFAIDVPQTEVLGIFEAERLYARIGLYLLFEQLQSVVVVRVMRIITTMLIDQIKMMLMRILSSVVAVMNKCRWRLVVK